VNVGVERRRSGDPVRIDLERAVKIIRAYVPGAIIRRTGQGLDVEGRQFAPYSDSYHHALVEMAEDTSVDLRLTGGLINSIKVRSVEQSTSSCEVTIAPDTGTSPAVHAANGRAKRSGRRGPPHNVLGWWLHHGTDRMPARPFMGLTPEQRAELGRLLSRAGVIVS
jgi:hypothetical protein